MERNTAESTVSQRFVTRSEFAQATTLNERTIDNYIASGTIKAIRVGRRVLIPLSELQRLEKEAGSK